MRAFSLTSVRRLAGAAAALCVAQICLAHNALADEIGALDGFFSTGTESELRPAPLGVMAAAPVMAPLGGAPGPRPRVELLLDEGGEPGAATLLSETGRRALRAAPMPVSLQPGHADPLVRREAAPDAAPDASARLRRLLRGGGPGPAAGADEDMLSRLFAGVEDPLSHALRQRGDPIRAGALLAAGGAAALDPALQAQAEPEAAPPPPPSGGFDLEAEALDRRMLLIGVGLLTALVAAATLIFSFAPTGGSSLKRR